MFSSLFQALTPSSSNSRSRREYAKHISNTATVVVLGEEDHLHHLPAHLRYNSYKDHLEKIMMHAAQVDVQEFPAKEVNSMGKGTGFSEPLSSFSNTTLPHPDADTSKNATIVAEDIAPVRTHMRRSFLGRHHPKVTSGSLTAEECGMYDNIQYANSSTGLKSIKEITNDEVEKKE
ncbi:hypothetical protein G7Y89_g9470 [Cudoniella acicularis]|uniref:Uncharacterized protein n=1 Tax=Cudoniella acicularis TaxID=354080 RepID=A0A8H4W1V1_9HELO|nr:hypothetical protein G7Y89_g9470 [Cudoniella acicularis]